MRDKQPAARQGTPAARVDPVGLTSMGHRMGREWRNDGVREVNPRGGPGQLDDVKGKGGSRFGVLDGTEDDLDPGLTIARLKQQIQEIQGTSERRKASPDGRSNKNPKRGASSNLMGRGHGSQNQFLVDMVGCGPRGRLRGAEYKTHAGRSGKDDVGLSRGRPSHRATISENVNQERDGEGSLQIQTKGINDHNMEVEVSLLSG